MREIKFRAWDTVKKRFDYEPIVMDGKVYDLDSFDGFVGFSEGRMILQQYTGLKDKNGKEIYEGDILQFVTFNYDGSDNGLEIGYVDWEEAATAYVIREKIGDEEARWLYVVLANDDEVEVIGNIWDNPELLEVPHE